MSWDLPVVSRGLIKTFRHSKDSVPTATILIPTTGVVVSEGLLFFGFIWLALWSHLLTLFVCTLAPLRFKNDPTMFQAFALVPVFRLVNLGMPVFFELTIYWFPLIYAPLIPAIFVLGRGHEAVTLNPGWKALILLPVALPVSALLGAVEFIIIEPEALIPTWSIPQLLLITVVMVGFVGLVEELLFRGVLQRALAARIGTWPGLLLASGLFGLMHSGYQTPEELVFAGTIGLVFGIIYHRTDSLALITIMHGVLNVFLFAIIPIHGPLPHLLTSLSAL